MGDSHDPTGLQTIPLSRRVAAQGAGAAGSRVSLLLYHRNGAEMVELRPGAGVTIGREAPADVVVQESSLSRRHACFTLLDDQVFVEDLGSLNGTRVGGQPITRRAVLPGEEITLGTISAAVHVHAGEEGSYGLRSHDHLHIALQAEVTRARYFGRVLSVLMVQAARTKEAHLGRWCPRVQELLRPVDAIALYSADAVIVLLPEISGDQAADIAKRIVACTDGDLPLRCGLASYPGAATTAEKLIEMARGALHIACDARPVQAAAEGARIWVQPAGHAGEEEERPVAASSAMRALFENAARFGRSAIPILLYGETGTGKEVLAKLIHHSSPRRKKPMVSVNCGAIPAELRESTLFGHVKGAFTGAIADRAGLFESAQGGTVLLDEIGELPPAAQTSFLRVLEAKRVTRVGSNKEIDVDVRIVAATHRDLSAMCKAGTFRQDLFYRLDAMALTIPPLRERREDIAALASRFLRRANELNGCALKGFDAKALELLETYAWPGNARELRNAVERAVVIAQGDVITADDLPDRVRAAAKGARSVANSIPEADCPTPPGEGAGANPPRRDTLPADLDGDYTTRMARLEATMLDEALRDAGWNQSETARRLNMPLRTLQHKIKALGLRRSAGGDGESSSESRGD